MAVSVKISGSLSAVAGVESTLATITDAGVYQAAIDTSGLAAGDTATITGYGKARAADAEQAAFVFDVAGGMAAPLVITPPLASPHHCRLTFRLAPGASAATVPWGVYQA